MIKRIIYIMSNVSLILLTVLVLSMLPFILQAGFFGILFIISILLLLILELFLILSKNYFTEYSFFNHIFSIIIMMYFSFFYYRVYTLENNQSSLYEVSVSYLKTNYFFLSLLVFVSILVTLTITYKLKPKRNV